MDRSFWNVSSSLNGLSTTVLFQCLSSRGVGVARPEAANDDEAALQVLSSASDGKYPFEMCCWLGHSITISMHSNSNSTLEL